MSIVFSNKKYSVTIKENGLIEAFTNLVVVQKTTSVINSKWAIRYKDKNGEGECTCNDFYFFSSEDMKISDDMAYSRVVILKGRNDIFNVCLNYFFYEDGFAFDMDISNATDSTITITDIVMSEAMVDGKMTLPMTQVDLSMGEADFIDEKNFFQNVNAFPVFINRASFCGIEWPVARNVFAEDRMTCTLYLGKTLEAGQGLPTTRKMYFGAAEEEGASVAFNKRIVEMRGRPIHRKSMYFSWLAHGWEGLSVKETDDLLDYFIMLNKEYGIHYDVFLFDAGIIESMHTYNREWRLMRPELMQNMERFAEKMKSIGTQLGVWLGPDGYGSTDEEATMRRETLKWMVDKWNVGMIKFDTAVSYPIKGDDPYYNNWYMEQLERTMYELRVIRPDLVVINHRIIDSPYILSILDSTLWSSMETYADTYLMNYTAPRPYSRMGTFERGMPNYCGSYNQLQEDHGVCFNGRQAGWKADFMVQAFGRALAVSPESYGTLFCLNDYDYPELSRMLQLAELYRDLLSNTEYINGDFVHSDGEKSLVCLINDNMFAAVKRIVLAGKDRVNAQVLLCTKQAYIDYGMNIDDDNCIYIEMRPFEVALLLVEDKVVDIETDVKESNANAKFGCCEPSENDCRTCEKIRFEISSDSLEYQEINSIPASVHPEVMTCRENFIEKMKQFNIISENAWDGRPDTAWADTWMYDTYDGKWRVNIGKSQLVSAVEFNLADIWPGPVIDEVACNRNLDEEEVMISSSDDGVTWVSANAKAIKEVSVRRHRVTKIVAGFEKPVLCKYIKLSANGIVVGNICIRDENGNLISPDRWKGNNLLSERQPEKVYAKGLTVSDDAYDKAYTVYVRMDDRTAPLTQEVAYAWLEPTGQNGKFVLPTITSPAYQFTSWESNSINEGNSWSFTFENLPVGKYVAKLAYIGPHFHPSYKGGEGCEKIVVGDFWS